MNIVISSGHGKRVSGAKGIIDEVTEARRVVSKVSSYLKQLGIDVTEYHDDTSETQSENINSIVAFHNSKERDIDISIHFNAFEHTDQPRGVEVLYLTEVKMAAKVSQAISDISGLRNRGAKKRTDLGFLNNTKKPAILIEVCFVDSTADVSIYQDKFDDICKTIAENISGKELPKPQDTPSSWAREAWTWATVNGIVDGTNPQDPCTREMVVTMLYRIKNQS